MENMAIQYDWAPRSVVKVFKSRPRVADETYEYDCYPPEPEEENYTFLQMKDFLTAYMGGLPMPITLSDGIQTYRMVRAIRESCRKRYEVPIPPPEVF
jgi:predicted dehydrogenase